MNKIKQFQLLIIFLFTGCGVPKEIIEIVAKDKNQMVDLPADYYLLQPRLEFAYWDKDYNSFNRFLTKDIMRTQMWMGFEKDGVEIAFCPNSAKTHVQLDTVSIILNQETLIGNWRAISNRRTIFIDSAVYADKKIYRNQETVYDEKEADVLLVLTDRKLSMYGTEKGERKYKKLPSRSYSLQNGRFLLGYKFGKAGGGVSFIGIDKEGRLILNWQSVEERKKIGSYITYQATVTQMIFKKV